MANGTRSGVVKSGSGVVGNVVVVMRVVVVVVV